MKGKINAKVFCRKNNSGSLDFYMGVRNEKFYMFTTTYYSYGIYSIYRNGVMIGDVFRNTRNTRQQKLNERIIRMAKYIELENSITVFNKKPKKDHHIRIHN